ncbi:hypothetical protein HUJ04_000472 [Dendroctonus ponderosae]|nr:hypothetical protein HUJ04_000472 [Dendroctonus ponderosae]
MLLKPAKGPYFLRVIPFTAQQAPQQKLETCGIYWLPVLRNKKGLVNLSPQSSGFGNNRGYSFSKHLLAIIYYLFTRSTVDLKFIISYWIVVVVTGGKHSTNPPKSDASNSDTTVATSNQINKAGRRQRRMRIPDKPNYPLNLWSIMKNCIGKDLSKIPMPVNFNEPLSMLQRLTEDYEYADILDKAAKCTDPCEQLAYVAAYTISSYATTSNRTGKPFNPLLGETYECDRTDDLAYYFLYAGFIPTGYRKWWRRDRDFVFKLFIDVFSWVAQVHKRTMSQPGMTRISDPLGLD